MSGTGQRKGWESRVRRHSALASLETHIVILKVGVKDRPTQVEVREKKTKNTTTQQPKSTTRMISGIHRVQKSSTFLRFSPKKLLKRQMLCN